MVDFSSVSMRILSPDGKNVLAELQTIDRVAVNTARRAGAAASAGIQQVEQRSAIAAREIAGKVAMIAQTGAASAESLKGIVSQGANIAFMFGTGGAVAGAIGVTGLAIVNLFTRARREIEETAQKAREELRSLTQAGDLGRVGGRFGAATQLFSGDPLAVRADGESDRAFEGRQLGILGMRNRIESLKALRDAAIAAGQAARASQLKFQMDEWAKALALVEGRYNRLIALQRELEDAEGFRAGRALEQLRESGQAARDRSLESLTRGGVPDVSLIGRPGLLATVSDMPGFAQNMLAGIQEALKKVPPLPPAKITPELERIANTDALAAGLAVTIGQTMVQGITDGIAAAVSGGGLQGGFEALTGAVLVGLGQMAIRIGTESVAFLQLMETIKNAIANFLPGMGLGAAFGLIGLGGLLVAAGSAMGGRAGRGGGSFAGGSSFGAGSGGTRVIDRGLVNPLNGVVTSPGLIQPRQSLVFAPTIIGTRDAAVQRDLVRMVRLGLLREGVVL